LQRLPCREEIADGEAVKTASSLGDPLTPG